MSPYLRSHTPSVFTRGAAFSAALCSLLVSAFAPSASAAQPDPIVAVTGGMVQGRMLEDGKGAVFRGVPFSQPPVGGLRWREPMPVAVWAGIRDASKSGPPAAQPSQGWNEAAAAASSEDCLYLDVWTPGNAPGDRRPVMVWIHGGANIAGAGGFDTLYDGRALIARGVVLVVVEYRLGVFGFFAHPELTRESPHHASGNYGVMDQAAALGWVRDNISHFGGDPGNVTLFGQSAGSSDVLALMASPLARGLFHRAIAESGPSRRLPRTPTLADTERAGVETAAKLNAPPKDALGFLRSLSTATLLKSAPWGIALAADGWALPQDPSDAFKNGKEAAVPLIIGSNAIEFPAAGSPGELRGVIQSVLGDLAPRALALYGLEKGAQPLPADPLYGNAGDQLGSDVFRCQATVQGEWHAAAGHPTWEYQFDRAIPPRPRTGHSSELPYVFGNLLSTGSQGGEFQPADHRLSDAILAYWTTFARTGNPNGDHGQPWPSYDGKARSYLDFTTAGDTVVLENERGAFCDLFREAMNRP